MTVLTACDDGDVSYAGGASAVEFEHKTVRMWKQPVDLFLRGGVGLLPLARNITGTVITVDAGNTA